MDWPRLRVHRRHVRLLLLLWLLKRAWRPLLRPLVRRVHRLLYSETPQLHYAPTPANAALLAACPVLSRAFCAPWHLPNGHAQTLQLASERDDAPPRILYQRQTLDMPDGGIVSLDWAFPPRPDGSLPRVSSLDPATPTLLLLPGLTGGSGEFYIRCAVHEMLAIGWQVVVLNARGCARTPLTTPQLFCCAYTDDLRVVLEQFHAQFAFTTLVAGGFSMGANVLVKYLGEHADDAPRVTAAVSVGNPFDLVACAAHLRATPFYRATYDRALAGNLQSLFFDTSNAHAVFANDPRLDLASVRDAHTLTQFDDRVTRVLFGYDSVHAYYADASSVTRLHNVTVPLLCLNARDDPISVTLPIKEARANPHVVLCVTQRGGHLGFYEDVDDGGKADKEADTRKTGNWAARAIAQFAESVRVQQQLK